MSLVVCPGRQLDLKQQVIHAKGATKDYMMLNRASSDYEALLAGEAAVVNPCPRQRVQSSACVCTVVLWSSRLPHCNGEHGSRMSGTNKFAASLLASESDHFAFPPAAGSCAKKPAWRTHFDAQGYVVLELAGVGAARRDQLLRELHSAVVAVNREAVPAELGDVTEHHLPPFKVSVHLRPARPSPAPPAPVRTPHLPKCATRNRRARG